MQARVLQPADAAKSRLEAYNINEIISKGSFGKVYRVTRKADGAVFALKQVDLEGMKRVDRKLHVAFRPLKDAPFGARRERRESSAPPFSLAPPNRAAEPCSGFRKRICMLFHQTVNPHSPPSSRLSGEEAIDEARMLARVDSPYVIRYFDCFLEGNVLNIIMEYASKGSLHQAIKVRAGLDVRVTAADARRVHQPSPHAQALAKGGKTLPEDKIWRYFIQSLLGLSHIHARRIIHRHVACAPGASDP